MLLIREDAIYKRIDLWLLEAASDGVCRLLSVIRKDGDWESWVRFFLEAVQVAANQAEENIVKITSLVASDRRKLLESPKGGASAYRLFEMHR